ncbi:hypothetical protein QAD02_003344 [Eretmocerus hayati]|uniref:Uncharacterized protein n=1 Tax=Eretmocerus hayati TaxID=131215 RepID=A0ACC2NLE6_9HYME|nr:hypothetical protein QAD02_003344 [Eretmocerus hayati]
MPHKLLINLTTDDTGKKTLTCKCSCKAGSLTCKHIIGSLEYLLRRDKDSLEVATCTDVTQKWGKLRNDVKAMYSYVPLKSHCHGKQAKSIKVQQLVTPDIKAFAFNLMTTDHSESSLSLSLVGVNRLAPALIPLVEDISDKYLTQEQCRNILSASICEPWQDDDLILYCTKDGVRVTFDSLSESEKVWFKDNVQVDLDAAVALCMKTKRNENTNHGIRNEPKARARYEELTGHTVTQSGSLVNPRIPWLLVSLDGIVYGSHTIEIKCPVKGKDEPVQSFMSSLPFIVETEPGVYFLKEKHSYYCQVQLGLFVSNLKYCDLIVYSSFEDNYLTVQVPYDSVAIEEYLSSLTYVYFAHMLKHLIAADTVADLDFNSNPPRRASNDLTNK